MDLGNLLLCLDVIIDHGEETILVWQYMPMLIPGFLKTSWNISLFEQVYLRKGVHIKGVRKKSAQKKGARLKGAKTSWATTNQPTIKSLRRLIWDMIDENNICQIFPLCLMIYFCFLSFYMSLLVGDLERKFWTTSRFHALYMHYYCY